MRLIYSYIAIIATLLLAVVVCACIVTSYVDRVRAEELLSIVANIQVGVAHRKDVEFLTKKFSKYSFSDQFPNLTNGNEYTVFLFRNRGFATLRLAPMKIVQIELIYEHDVVTEKAFHFAEEPNRGAILDESANYSSKGDFAKEVPPATRKVTERGLQTNPTYMLGIQENTSVAAARRRLDWSIDLTCMTALGACNPHDVLRGASD